MKISAPKPRIVFEERLCTFGCVSAARRLVEAVPQKEHAVGLDVHDTRVGGVVARDVPYPDRHAAELEVEPALEDDVGLCYLNLARRGQLLLHVRRVLLRGDSFRHPTIERLIAPVRLGHLGQRRRGLQVSDHRRADLRRTEDVIPVRVRENGEARRLDTHLGEPVEDDSRMRG